MEDRWFGNAFQIFEATDEKVSKLQHLFPNPQLVEAKKGRSNTSVQDKIAPRKPHSFNTRGFSVSGPAIWNSIPLEV